MLTSLHGMVVVSMQIVNHNFIFKDLKHHFRSNTCSILWGKTFLKSSVSDCETLFKCKVWLEQVPARNRFSISLCCTILSYANVYINFLQIPESLLIGA